MKIYQQKQSANIFFKSDSYPVDLNRMKSMLYRIFACLLLLMVIVPAHADTSNSKQIDNPCQIPKSETLTPPKVDGEPVEVSIGIFIIDIIELNELKGSFKLDFTVDVYWLDPRLSAAARGGPLSQCHLSRDQIWFPAIQAINIRNPSHFILEDITVNDSGRVSYYARVQANLASPFDLHEFPFDNQALKIKLASFVYGPEDVIFLEDTKYTGMLGGIELAGWSILGSRTNVDLAPITTGNGDFSQMHHVISVQRKAAYYMWNYVVPLCFIVLMAGSVLFLDPESFGAQIGITTAAVFTLVAFLLGLRQGLPQVAYLTRMDELVLAATVLVFLSFGEVIYASRLVNKGRSNLARRVDFHARWVYFGIFAVLLYVIIIAPMIS